MLFSEPKIPQFRRATKRPLCYRSFSALQRAENSSISACARSGSRNSVVSVLFSEPKIPQFELETLNKQDLAGFSALQRAENSSIMRAQRIRYVHSTFQCSSASRKFLNQESLCMLPKSQIVSVLFSEPKIPQFRVQPVGSVAGTVSVLFSEPKIPQLISDTPAATRRLSFSALQRAENSSITGNPSRRNSSMLFQCSSASRKFLNAERGCGLRRSRSWVSVLFSEPKIPQFA